MIQEYFSQTFQILQIKERDLISLWEPILWNGWIIRSPILYFHFKSFDDPNSASWIRSRSICNDSGVLFPDFPNFCKLKRGHLISWWEAVLKNGCIIFPPLLYFNFKSFKGQNSSLFIRFPCALHDSEVILSDFKNFHKLKRRNLISWWDRILQNGWIIWSPLLYFNLKSFEDPNNAPFIRFQSIQNDSGVLFSDFWSFHKLKTGRPNFLGEPILQKHWIIWSPTSVFQF